MNRRRFLCSSASLAGLVAFPFSAFAQVGGTRAQIVWFGSAIEANAGRFMNALHAGLADLGHAQGRTYDFIPRFAENRVERLPAMAAEIVAMKPAVIVCGGTDSVIECRKLTSSIPLVSAALADAEHLGLVASYARPGGNVTGVMPYIAGLPSKQIELARELLPTAKKVGILGNTNDPKAAPQADELEKAARGLGLATFAPGIQSAGDLEAAMKRFAEEKVDVVVVLQTNMILSLRKQLATLMAEHRLPAIYGYREHADEGGLISYGVDLRWCWNRSATFVHRIIKGERPGDLPVEFPSKIQLVINASAAKALGLNAPPQLLVRADQILD